MLVLRCTLSHESPLTVTSGALGTAILCGVLASLGAKDAAKARQHLHNKTGEATRRCHDVGIPNRFIACVRTGESAGRLEKVLAQYPNQATVSYGENNLRSLEEADIVLLGVQPQDLTACLDSPAVKAALKGKLLVSIIAGITISQIEALLPQGPGSSDSDRDSDSDLDSRSSIVRAMPNIASFVHSSTTVITAPRDTPAEMLRIVDWLFAFIGTVTHIPSSKFDTCTALCASTPAFFALFLEAIADGAVALGLKRQEAQLMAAGAMKGAAELVLDGDHPTTLREKVMTPGGSTIRGVLALERLSEGM